MSQMVILKRVATVAMLGMALSGCSTVKGWFAGKDAEAKKLQEPVELVKFDATVKVDKLWTVNLGKGEERIGVRQGPAVADGRVFAAAITGGVHAIDLQTGKKVWTYEPAKEKKKPKLRLSGGPGVGDGLVVIGTLDGQVIALDAADGTEKWRAKVPGEVISAPAVGQGMVFVRSNDGRITSFDATNGTQRWFNPRELPMLTVRGNAPVVQGPGVVFVGNDDGTLAALGAADGRTLWDQVVGNPEGRTELDRMADVDGAPVLEGSTLYASSFKNQTIAIEGPTGRPLWTRDHGGAGGVTLSSSYVIVTDNQGGVFGLDKQSGAASWSQTGLARRQLTGPALQGDYVVVGDFDGYVHWLQQSDGAMAARAKTGGTVKAQPIVADGVLLVQNIEGKLTAFRLAN
ncbi:lipoprotein [Stenotrophomonas chelatiphaga]|jgi:outer membrane protein assembly factor BamB|uniref:Outer membrane protein assembly factor BamB n=1 Tax=Stenotrophomonas chelatiphaga TaxID=517011 RepID=A0A0R0DHN3_9GAMM|nr:MULTISPECIES: outer membrane protein assembly factor BamB [Stenotrophomonas]KRG77633.1 lipoprotein [Stenotrophomonas chelatiphaga]MCS4229743.1 outer membrane protein assembly factor BamB [Stenotrophomonas chelatiphaga]MDR6094809.1 outer membrane protein assembly factor BamB [Stenotrophomonas sp. SORGH_AS_0321]ROQ36984.1 Beta-barrel assembly machine subunit BamB [Stenotrophomonas maltophilia]